jgi:hypothetical protein
MAENPLLAGHRIDVRPETVHWIGTLRNKPPLSRQLIYLSRRPPREIGWIENRACSFCGDSHDDLPVAGINQITLVCLRVIQQSHEPSALKVKD